MRKQLTWLNFSLTIKKYSSSATPGLLKKGRKRKRNILCEKYININKYLAPLKRRDKKKEKDKSLHQDMSPPHVAYITKESFTKKKKS